MVVVEEFKTFANNYHKQTQGRYLPKLPNDIIMNIFKQVKSAKQVHREKYVDVLKQLIEKTNGCICMRVGNQRQFWEHPHFLLTPVYGWINKKQMLTRNQSLNYPEGKIYNISHESYRNKQCRWISEKELELYIRTVSHMCWRSQPDWEEPDYYIIHGGHDWCKMSNRCIEHLYDFVCKYRESKKSMWSANYLVENYHILRQDIADIKEFRHLKKVYDKGPVHWTKDWINCPTRPSSCNKGGIVYDPDFKHTQELNGYELYVKKFKPMIKLPTKWLIGSDGVMISYK